jgi:amidophosphoribosyltransferase
MLTTNPFDLEAYGDKLREECGVFGIWGADTAAAVAALGLHALQHRGQEAAGITSRHGKHFHSHRGMGRVGDIFAGGSNAVAQLHGSAAIGHVRYATTGETALRNVQPLFAELALGGFAVAHNGNISNAMSLRGELNRRGSIFQSTSDTEVIIHLIATSTYRDLLDRFIDALRRVEGAYSLVCLTEQGLIACRDPLGIRPLVMGKLGNAVIFASETVALDVVGATYLRTVEPGELIVVNDDGIRSLRPFGETQARPASSSTSISRGLTASSTAPPSTRSASRSAPSWRARTRWLPTWSCRSPTAVSRRRSATRRKAASRLSSASFARIMSAAPSSSRPTRSGTSA